jgi:hypothetical protein
MSRCVESAMPRVEGRARGREGERKGEREEGRERGRTRVTALPTVTADVIESASEREEGGGGGIGIEGIRRGGAKEIEI